MGSEFARRIIEERGLDTYTFPCCVGHKDHDWFEGRTVFRTCDSVHKCEWLSIVKRYIAYINEHESKDYKLMMCPDKEPGRQNDPEPDAKLIDVQNKNENFVIEVKTIHELDDQRNKDVKSFTEFTELLYYHLNKNVIKLEEYPYGLLMDEDIRWGKQNNQKLTNMQKVTENIQRIIDHGFVNAPKCFEDFEVDGVGFRFLILDAESARENNVKAGSIHISGRIKRGSTADLKPPEGLFDEYISKVLNMTKKKFKSYSDTQYRKALLIVNESNYIGSYIYDNLRSIEMLEKVELWFANPILEEIDEFGNEEFYGEYEVKRVK